ncbi:7711_t:CDS:1, partial [Ambispora leptoticha]
MQECLITEIELYDDDIGPKVRDVLKLPKGVKTISSLPDIVDT